MKQFWNKLMQETEVFLTACGAEEMEGFFVFRNAEWFWAGSGIFGICGFMIGFLMHPLAGVAGFTAGLFGPAALLYLSNERDNKVILKDLKWLYETITVQLQAGLHIQQALAESEGLIKNKRLKKALRRLVVRLMRGDDLDLTLTCFERSFRNNYISSFCLILRQMKESGYAVKLLEDIRVQMEEMERIDLKKKKEVLEMQLQVFQMLLFVGILVMVMHGCILAVLDNINFL